MQIGIVNHVPFPPAASRERLEQLLHQEERELDKIQLETAATTARQRTSEVRMQRDLQLLQATHRATTAGEVLQVGVAAAVGAVGIQLGVPGLLVVPVVAAFTAFTARGTIDRQAGLRSQRVEAENTSWNDRHTLYLQRGLESQARQRVNLLRDAVARMPAAPQPPNLLELAASI